MKTRILSPKDKGNTYKVASHLAQTADAELLVLENGTETDLRRFDRIVLCSGVYADKIHGDLAAWLNGIRKEQFREGAIFHVFLTWFGRGKSDQHAMAQAVNLLAEKRLSWDPDYGSCFGGMYFIRKGHPDGQDLAKAEQWLKKKTNSPG